MAGRIAYYGNISPQGLVLNLDAAIVGSYPKTGSTWFDISNNGNNGTLTNGPTFTGSDYGAIVFDGTNDFINVTNSNSINFSTNDFGCSTWLFVNSQSLASNREYGIINKNSGFQTSPGWGIEYSTWGYTPPFNQVGIECFNSGQTSWGNSNIGGTITTQRWHNIVLIRTNQVFDFYLNGSPVNRKSNADVALNISNSIDLKIGNAGSWQYSYKGQIANTQIYNQSLTQFQIWQNFNAYKSRYGIPDIVTDGLVLNLDAGNPYSYLSGSSGTTWSNTVAVSSSISGSLQNGAVYSNGAITFDGSNDYVFISSSIPAGLRIGEGDFTIDFWIYTLGTGAYSVCGNLNDAEGDGSYWVLVNSTYTGLQTIQFGSKGNSEYKFGTTALTPNVWTNVTLSRIGTTMTAYINANTYATPITINNFTGNFNIDYLLGISKSGTNYNRYPLNGRLGVLKIYKGKGLTQTEITQNFNALRGRYGI
jgi:hypothetical protein